jgi:hypothetical protein
VVTAGAGRRPELFIRGRQHARISARVNERLARERDWRHSI